MISSGYFHRQTSTAIPKNGVALVGPWLIRPTSHDHQNQRIQQPSYHGPHGVYISQVSITHLLKSDLSSNLPIEGKVIAMDARRLCINSKNDQDQNNLILVVASNKEVIMCNLSLHQETEIMMDVEHLIHTQILESSPQHVALNFEGDKVSICCQDVIWVIDTKKSYQKFQLVGHDAALTMTAFAKLSEGNRELLFSLSEDRTFKVWDIEKMACVYQSNIISVSPLNFVSIHQEHQRMVLSSDDGTIRFFDLSIFKDKMIFPKQLNVLVLSRIVQMITKNDTRSKNEDPDIITISSAPFWRTKHTYHSIQQTIGQEEHEFEYGLGNDDNDFSDSTNIIALQFYKSFLCVATNNMLLLLDCNSYNILEHIRIYEISDLDSMDACEFNLDHDSNTQFIRSISCVVINRLSRQLQVIHWKPKALLHIKGNGTESLESFVFTIVERHLTGSWIEPVCYEILFKLHQAGIVEMNDILKDNLINLDLPEYFVQDIQCTAKLNESRIDNFKLNPDLDIRPKSLLSLATKATSTSLNSKSGSSSSASSSLSKLDKPVTFRSKVKSSGYTQAPRATSLFKLPSSKSSSPSKPTFKSKSKSSSSLLNPESVKSLVYDESCISKLKIMKSIDTTFKHNSPVLCMRYNSSGKQLITGTSGKSVRWYKFLKESIQSKDFTGHDASVTSVSFSYKPHCDFGTLALSTCNDGYAKLWIYEKSEPLLTFPVFESSKVTRASSATTNNSNTMGGKEIPSGQFYYKDRFILLPRKSELLVYDYQLQKPLKGSVTPSINLHSFNSVKSYTTDAQQITTIAAVNSYFSQYVITATSNRSIDIWDLNSGKIAQAYKDAQSRPIHSLALLDQDNWSHEMNDATISHSSLPFISQCCFLSAAITDSIKVWDTRLQKSVMHLHGHLNRHASIAVNISPCGQYVITGSEVRRAGICFY